MIDNSIAFLDSGIGGLPYLDWVRMNCPRLKFSYIADSAHFPYGELSAELLCYTVLDTVERIFTVGTPRLLVIACNTASVTALDAVRAVSPCPVVGTVPAVKQATIHTGNRPIAVLATQGTIDSPYLDRLISAVASEKHVILVRANNIVRFIEEQWVEEGVPGAVELLEPALNEIRSAGVGTVVLGCTHFLHVLDLIAQGLGEGVVIVDSRVGVGRRILSLLEGSVDSEVDSLTQENCLYVTSQEKDYRRYARFAQMHELHWAGTLS